MEIRLNPRFVAVLLTIGVVVGAILVALNQPQMQVKRAATPHRHVVQLVSDVSCPAPPRGTRYRLRKICYINLQYLSRRWTLSGHTGGTHYPHVGPSRATAGGEMWLHPAKKVGTNRWEVQVSITHPNPTSTYSRPRVPGNNCPPHQRCWYAPMTWNWQKILGKFWYSVVDPCLSGASKGMMTTVGGITAWNFFAYAAAAPEAFLEINPAGLAVVGISKCAVGIWNAP